MDEQRAEVREAWVLLLGQRPRGIGVEGRSFHAAKKPSKNAMNRFALLSRIIDWSFAPSWAMTIRFQPAHTRRAFLFAADPDPVTRERAKRTKAVSGITL